MVWGNFHQSSTSPPLFPASEPKTAQTGQALLGCVSDDPYLFRTFVRVVQPAPRCWKRDTNCEKAVGFLKIRDRGYHCIYIYILYNISIHVEKPQMIFCELIVLF